MKMITTLVVVGGITLIGVIIALTAGIRIVNQTERALILRLGKHKREVGSGFHWIVPVVVTMSVLGAIISVTVNSLSRTR